MTDTTCKVIDVMSRVCERGTSGCVTKHGSEGSAMIPPSERPETMNETHAKTLISLHSLSNVLTAIDDDDTREALRAGAAALRASERVEHRTTETVEEK